VRIDRTKPAPKALKNLAVTHGHRVKLPYRVNDNVSPKAKVWIRIYRGTKRVCTKALGTHLTNRTHTCSFRCKLRKGKYTWRVYATDLAGNTQAKAGVKRLGVK
jgi:hypothetical protein